MTKISGSSVPQYLCDPRTMHDGQFLWIRATHGHTLKTVDVKSGLYVEPSAFVAFWAWIFQCWKSPVWITAVAFSLAGKCIAGIL